MRKAWKYRLYPTRKQEQKLFWTLARCRELYNAALSERRDAYKYAGTSVSYYEQKRDLPEIKAKIREEYQDIHSQVLQDVLLRLDKAFKAFFRRIKRREEPGYPRFQGRHRYDSFTYPQPGGFSLTHDGRICLSKIGSIKVKLHREIKGTLKTATVKHEAGQWYIIFSCEIAQPEPLPVVESETGIDLGVTHFAALSDGTFIESPRHFRKAEKKLARLQQALSRKKRGSHRRNKARQAVAKAHRNIKNQRRDFQHKQSTSLLKQYQTIVFEKLEITNLTKHAKPKQDENGTYLPNGARSKSGLTRSILDAGWGQFQQMCVQSSICWPRHLVRQSPLYLTSLLTMWNGTQKIPGRTVALLRMRVRTG